MAERRLTVTVTVRDGDRLVDMWQAPADDVFEHTLVVPAPVDASRPNVPPRRWLMKLTTTPFLIEPRPVEELYR